MKNPMVFAAVLLLATGAAVPVASAQTPATGAPPAGSPAVASPGASAGAAPAGTTPAPGATVATCAACHGAQGEGNAAGGFPRLAGQSQTYLAKQLTDYASGARNHPVMTPIAKGLTPAQMGEAAGYYAAIDAPSAKKAATAAAATRKRGELLAAVGDENIGVQACANCHGPGGVGEWPAYPFLKGQHASYLSAALGNWKNGSRNNDPSRQMPSIAKKLNDADVAAVSAYYAQLNAPTKKETEQNIPAGNTARPVVVPTPAPGAASLPATGTGSEQGSPTQGGSQGPGGGGAASGSGTSGTPAKGPSQ